MGGGVYAHVHIDAQGDQKRESESLEQKLQEVSSRQPDVSSGIVLGSSTWSVGQYVLLSAGHVSSP